MHDMQVCSPASLLPTLVLAVQPKCLASEGRYHPHHLHHPHHLYADCTAAAGDLLCGLRRCHAHRHCLYSAHFPSSLIAGSCSRTARWRRGHRKQKQRRTLKSGAELAFKVPIEMSQNIQTLTFEDYHKTETEF